MSEPVTQTYREIEITLLEDENKWRFTANGRERSAPTLPKAREAIDRALDEVKADKVKKWQPFEAYYKPGYSNDKFQKVTVTSQAEDGQFWISNKNKDHRGFKDIGRSKERANSLYAMTPENDKRIAVYQALLKESEALETRISEALSNIEHVATPKD